MKKILVIILSLFLLSKAINAQDAGLKQNQISVLGSIELKEIADQASVTFAVKGIGSSLRKAVDNASKMVQKVTDKLITLGIKSKNISTSQFYSGENSGDKAFLSSSRDYKAILHTLVKIVNMKSLDSALYLISESEIEDASNIIFSLNDELGLRRKARVAAAMKAKEKAEDIAGALGVMLGKVVNIEEMGPTSTVSIRGGRTYPNPFNPSTSMLREESIVDESKGSGFFAQTISITSQVRVVFEIK